MHDQRGTVGLNTCNLTNLECYIYVLSLHIHQPAAALELKMQFHPGANHHTEHVSCRVTGPQPEDSKAGNMCCAR